MAPTSTVQEVVSHRNALNSGSIKLSDWLSSDQYWPNSSQLTRYGWLWLPHS